MKKARTILLALLLASAAAPAAARPAQTVNCVVAVVNGQIITLLDVEVVAAFGLGFDPAVEPSPDPRRTALEALIDRKVVLDLARDTRVVDRDELAGAAAALERNLGPEAYRAGLLRFGLAPRDLEAYLEESLLYERALTLRFSSAIPVSVTEVERHYRDIYLPEQARTGAAVEPLDKIASTIEARIRGERRAAQTAAWIRDLRKNADILIKKDCLK